MRARIMPSIFVALILLVLLFVVMFSTRVSGCEYMYPYGEVILCGEGWTPVILV